VNEFVEEQKSVGNLALLILPKQWLCVMGQKQMCQICDSQNAFGEKVRWGKNLNIGLGLSVGIFFFS